MNSIEIDFVKKSLSTTIMTKTVDLLSASFDVTRDQNNNLSLDHLLDLAAAAEGSCGHPVVNSHSTFPAPGRNVILRQLEDRKRM